MPEAASTDTFLARRFNFLGFPGERRADNAKTYPELRAEMGDDNAAALVTRIGEMVTKQGLEALGVPLHHAVDRIVQSLSADERCTMAEGGSVARVQALITSELATAKQQHAPINIHGAGKAPGNVIDVGEKLPGFMSNRGGNQFAALRDKGVSSSAEASAAGVCKALGAEGFTRTQIAGAIDYAKSIGIGDPAYAGYFVGSSQRTRDAIAAHVRDGKRITDDDVEKPEDVTAVVGAIKAKKMKSEEAPPSVQDIMGQMKKDGVDPATAPSKAVRKWMKDHPKALDAAKKEAKADIKAREGLTEEQKQKQNEAAEKERGATQSSTATTSAATVKPKTKKLSLDG